MLRHNPVKCRTSARSGLRLSTSWKSVSADAYSRRSKASLPRSICCRRSDSNCLLGRDQLVDAGATNTNVLKAQLPHLLGVKQVATISDQRPRQCCTNPVKIGTAVRLPLCQYDQRVGTRERVIVVF